MEISTAPPIEPAMIERRGLGFVSVAGFWWVGGVWVVTRGGAVVVIAAVVLRKGCMRRVTLLFYLKFVLTKHVQLRERVNGYHVWCAGWMQSKKRWHAITLTSSPSIWIGESSISKCFLRLHSVRLSTNSSVITRQSLTNHRELGTVNKAINCINFRNKTGSAPAHLTAMLSRAIFRSLPRTTSRLASYTTRTHLKPSIQSSLRQSLPRQFQQTSRAAFTTSSRCFDDVSQELAAKLTNEIDLEAENTDSQHDSDAGVKTFLDQNDFWTLEAQEGQQDVLLRRQYDDETITVSFSIADFNTASIMPEEDADEAFADEEEELGTAQSGGANTKGAINQGTTNGGNFKVAPEDSVAPADREELRNEDVRLPSLSIS